METAGHTTHDMGESDNKTVLRRITAAGREVRKARLMTLQKALRLTLAKVADQTMDLPMAVIGVKLHNVPGEAVEEAFDDSQLILELAGSGDCVGAAMLEVPVVGALIQQQTTGTVFEDSGETRKLTRTDAAICAPLIDTLFSQAKIILDDETERAFFEGYEFTAKAEDARTLAMSLNAAEYTVITLTVDIARGVRQGEIVLVLPTLSARLEQTDGTQEAEASDAAGLSVDMATSVMKLNADLEMVVARLNLPLNAVRNLQAGQIFDLPPDGFPNVQITTRLGRVLGRGLVGHVDGVRAVQPLRPPSHADRPLRRLSDQDDIDMPQVEVLTATGRRKTLPREQDVTDEEIEEAMKSLPPITDAPVSMPIADNAEPAMAGKNRRDTDADLPELDDLPDLDDLPNLEDLGDLPDLADLPDLDILPMS